MNVIAISPKWSSLLKLAGAMLVRLSKVAKPRPGPHYVKLDEFTAHLQRDMGILDGRCTRGTASSPNAHDRETRDWMR
jgi:hypothetical protein